MANETGANLKQKRTKWFDPESGRPLALNGTPALTVNEVKQQLSPLSKVKPINYFKQGKTRTFIGPRNDRTDVLDYLERIGVGKDKLDKYRYDSKNKGKLNLAGLSADEKTELSDLYGKQLTKRRNDLRDKLSKADPNNRFRDYKSRTRMEVIADLMPSGRTRAALGYADPNVRPGMSAADPNSIAASAAGVGAAAASHAGARGTSASGGGSGYSVFRGSGRVGAGGINFREFGMSSGGTSGWLGGTGGAGREAGKAMRTFFQNGPRGNAFYNGRWEYTGGEITHDNPDGTPYFTKSTAGGYTSTSSAEKEWKRKAFEINRAQTIAYNNYLMSAQGKRERAMNQLADEFALMEEQAARTVRDELRASKEMAKRGIIPVFDNSDAGRNAADVSWFLRKPPEVARREEAEMATPVTPPEKKPKEGATT